MRSRLTILLAAAIVGTFSASSLFAQIPAPLAYWSFDTETDATRQINDVSDNNHAGIRFGLPGDPTNGIPSFSNNVPAALGSGRSLSFDDFGDARANQQYVALDMSFLGNNALPQVSASAWFRTSYDADDFGQTPGTVENRNWAIIDFDRSDYFDLYVRDTDGAIGFATRSTTGDIHDMVGNTTDLNDGAWHHVAVVYDGDDKHIFVDGAPDGTASNPHGGAALGSTNARFGFIGDGTEATSFNSDRNELYYDGAVDDLAVWKTALSATQVAELEAGTASPGDSVSAPPTLPSGSHSIDFEEFAGVTEGTPFADRIIGMHFEGATVVHEGSPLFGFGSSAGDDTPQAGEMAGGVMLTDVSDADASPNPVSGTPFNPIVVTWNGRAIEDLTFDIIDLDGTHQFRGSVYGDLEGNDLLGSLLIDAGDPNFTTGDGIVTQIDFTPFSGIRRLEFELENLGSGNSGFGVDNFSFTVVPEPASIAIWSLLAVVLTAWGHRRLRRSVK